MNESSNIQNSLFETMKIFSESATAKSKAAVTIEGVITEIQDLAAGIYSVEYFNSTITAHTGNNSTYSIGDNVYILVPEGDFSKEKIILGLITASADSISDTKEDSIYYNDITDNLIELDNEVISLSSYVTIAKGVNQNFISARKANIYSSLIKKYLENYRTFKFSFSVKTGLSIDQQNSGNYGISISIPIIMRAAAGDDLVQSWRTFYLDTANFLGTPYNYLDWTTQTIYFNLDKSYEYDDSRIPYYSYYCYDFRQDSAKAEIYDIWLKDVNLQIVEKVAEETINGYYLSIKATQGEYFATYYQSTKTLTPTLKINGKETSLKNSEIYWFVEDASIKANSLDYLNYGGYGWRCINNSSSVVTNDDGTQTKTYISDKITRTVEQAEVAAATNFKCVVVYKQKVISAIITLKNLSSDGEIYLLSNKNLTISGDVVTLISSPDNVYIKDTGYVNLSALVRYADATAANIYHYWSRYDKNGKYLEDDNSFFSIVENNKLVTYNNEEYYLSTIKFPVNQIEDLNTVYCTSKYINSKTGYSTIIGTANLVITTTILSDLNLIINGDNVVYKYDSDGDSPTGTAYDGPTTSKVTSITPLTYSLYKANGKEFTADEYKCVRYTWKIPKTTKGMFTLDGIIATSEDDNYYYVSGTGNASGLTYKIANRFNISKSKEPIILTIVFNGQEISRNAIITFLKEGMSGSNGTAYAAALVSGGLTAASEESVAYGILNKEGYGQKLRYVYNSISKKLYRYDYETHKLFDVVSSNKRIFPLVWRDGSLLIYNTDYSIEYSMFDSKVNEACLAATKQSDGSCLVTLSAAPSASSCNIVQAKITVKDGNSSVASASQIIYAYYPIELTIINGNVTLYPAFEGGFAEVMYASDGTNPSYDETSLFKIADSNFYETDYDNAFLDNFDIVWESQNHLGLYKLSDGGYPIGQKRNSLTDFSAVKVKPDNKYDDGNSHNYVKATLSFNGDEVSLNKKKSFYTELQNSKSKEFSNLMGILSSTRNSIELFNLKFSSWLNIIDAATPLFNQENKIDQYLEELISVDIPEAIDYTEMGLWVPSAASKTMREFLKNQVILCAKELTEKVVEARAVLYELDDVNQKLSNLIDLSKYKIGFDKGNLAQYQSLIEGANSQYLTVINLAFDKINEAIDNYQNQCSILKSGSYSSYLVKYYQIKEDISEIADLLDTDYKNLFLRNIDKLDQGVSYSYILSVVKEIPYSIPNVFFTINSAEVALSDAYLDGLTSDAAAAQKEADLAAKQIAAIEAILSAKGKSIIHIRPIVLYYNRYSMSNISAWDGNKIETGDNDSYLLAPQVGAGIKNADNSFTGMVMGLRNVSDSTSSLGRTTQTGLFGYSQGKQSLFMSADSGATILGLAGNGGQIIIDPSASAENSGAIYSSNYFTADGYNSVTGLPKSLNSNKSGKGMLINFSEPSISFGSGYFKVDKNGNLTAGGGGDGSVGGWSITNTTLQSNNYKARKNGICLDAANDQIVFGSSNGKLYSGSHLALTNTLDGFYLSQDGLSIGSKVKITSDGTMYLGNGAVEGTGKHWSVDTQNGESYIAYGTTAFKDTAGVYMGTDGIRLGEAFSVNASGSLIASSADVGGKITATSGIIGGCIIENGTLKIKNANIESLDVKKLTKDGVFVEWNKTKFISGFRAAARTNSIHYVNEVSSDGEGGIDCEYGSISVITKLALEYKFRATAVLGNTEEDQYWTAPVRIPSGWEPEWP